MNSDTRPIDTVFLDSLLFGQLGLDRMARYFVAFSGGMDSTVLLHMVAALRQDSALNVTALHLDHGLQGESAAWMLHCEKFCNKLNVRLISSRIEVIQDRKIGPEASARKARYRWFLSQIQGDGAVLLTAHHQQDQVETFFLNLLRGTGVDGLGATRQLTRLGPHRLVRPFLDTPRESICEYAKSHKLDWITDPSNSDTRYSRNKVRAELLPTLFASWPAAADRISSAISNLQNTSDFLDEVAEGDLSGLQKIAFNCLDKSHGLDISSTAEWSRHRFNNTLRAWLKCLGYGVPGKQLTDALSHWRRGGTPAGAVLRKGKMEFRLYRGILYVMPPLEERPVASVRPWPDLGQPLKIPEIDVTLCCDNRLLETNIGNGVLVRGRQGGERLISPARGMSLSLRKVYQDKAIPPWLRYRIPLIFQGDSIIAIPGVGQFGECEKIAPEAVLFSISPDSE